MAVLTLTEKLDRPGARYDELTQQLSTSEVASDSARYQKVAKQHAELEQIVERHREFKQTASFRLPKHLRVTIPVQFYDS